MSTEICDNDATRRNRELLWTEEVRGVIVGGDPPPARYAAHRYTDGARVWGPYYHDSQEQAIKALREYILDRWGKPLAEVYPGGLELREWPWCVTS